MRQSFFVFYPHEWSVLIALGHAEKGAVSREELREVLGDETGNMADVYT